MLIPELFYNSVEAQTILPQFRHYTIRDGLPSSEVYDAIQDSKGYMWFATDRGVARFNGYEFRSFSSNDGLLDNTIFKLFEDSKGRIWMYSYSSKLYFFENGKIYPYKFNDILHDINPEKVISNYYVDNNDDVYLAINELGEFKIDSLGKIEWIIKFQDKEFQSSFIDERQPSKLMYCSNFKYSFYEQIFIINQLQNKRDTSILKDVVCSEFCAFRLNKERLLISINKSLYEQKGKNLKLLFNPDEEILHINKDRSENVLIGTRKGCYVFYHSDFSKGSSIYLDKKSVSSFIQDKEGGYWFMTLEDGIWYLPGHGILNFQFNEESLQKPMSLSTDLNSSVYAGFRSGDLVQIRNGITKLVYTAKDSARVRTIFNLTFLKGKNRIFLSSGGIHTGYFSNDTYHHIKSEVNSFIKTNLLVRSNGDILGACSGGISKVIGDSIKIIKYKKLYINCLAETKNKEILLGCNNGVLIYDEINDKTKIYRNSLFNIRVDDIKWFQNNLSFATKGKGVLFLINDSVFKIEESNGLISNLVNKILVDGNSLWCATNKGLSHIYFSDFKKFKYTITNIQETDGLPGDEINDLILFKDTLYVATSSGISFFNKNTDFITLLNPPVYITGFNVNSRDTLINDKMEFSYLQNNIRIRFEGLSYRSDEKINYLYQLINDKDTLSSNTSNREVDFFSLNPGNYQFRVYAINYSGVKSRSPANISFVIKPPWWQSWIFRLAIFLGVVTLFFVFYKIRVRRLNEKFLTEKKQATMQLTAARAQMNPHFIFNVMDSIRNYMMDNDMSSAEKYLTSFAKLVRYTLDRSDKQVSSLEEEMSMIRAYIDLEKERFSNNVEVDISYDNSINISEISIPTMILQPFVENAFKHGLKNKIDDGRLIIKVVDAPKGINVIIEDNGRNKNRGLPETSAHQKVNKSYGTSLVNDRISSYNKAAFLLLIFVSPIGDNDSIEALYEVFKTMSLFEK